jgi:hypothetical protein
MHHAVLDLQPCHFSSSCPFALLRRIRYNQVYLLGGMSLIPPPSWVLGAGGKARSDVTRPILLC